MMIMMMENSVPRRSGDKQRHRNKINWRRRTEVCIVEGMYILTQQLLYIRHPIIPESRISVKNPEIAMWCLGYFCTARHFG